MKKKLVYTLVGIVIIILCCYFYRYRQASFFEDRIPSSATTIINIDLRKIENSLLKDIVKNPSTVFSSSSEDEIIVDEEDEHNFGITKGVKIPRNIILYANSTSLKEGFYSSVLSLKDVEELHKYLLNEGFELDKKNELQLFYKGNIIFATRAEELIIAYKLEDNIEGIEKVFSELFVTTEFLTKDDESFKQLEASKSEITIVTPELFLTANFKKGKFVANGIVNNSQNYFRTNSLTMSSKKDIAFFKTHINLKTKKAREQLKDWKGMKVLSNYAKLNTDSIVNSWNGSFDFELNDVSTKIDTIVTYSYDDDFNKVEAKVVHQEIVPKMHLRLGEMEKNGLYDYLATKGAIKIAETDTLFTLIPLYTFYVNHSPLEIMTSKYSNISKNINSELLLDCYFNIENYKTSGLWIPSYIEDITAFESLETISLKVKTNGRFNFTIDQKNTNRYFLGELLFPSLD